MARIRTTSLGAAGMAASLLLLGLGGCATDTAPRGPIAEVNTFDMRSADPDRVARALEQDGRVTLRGITFDTGSAQLQPGSDTAVASIGRMMTDNPDLKLAVVGHTDNVGAFEANKALSERRAGTIVDTLRRDYAIGADRLTAVGVGELVPIAPNTDEAGRAQNRRVELVVIE